VIDDTGGVRTFTLDWSDYQAGLRKRAPLLIGFLLLALILGSAIPAIVGGAIGGILTVILMTRAVYRGTAISIGHDHPQNVEWPSSMAPRGHRRRRLRARRASSRRDACADARRPVEIWIGNHQLTRPWPGPSLRAIAAALPATSRDYLDESLTMAQLRRRYPAADL
jgi:hypothetical protein